MAVTGRSVAASRPGRFAFRNPFAAYADSAFPGGVRVTFWRSLQTFCLTRILIASLLLVYLHYSPSREARALDGLITPYSSAAYVGLAVVFALLSIYLRRRFMLQLMAQTSVDILVITKLYIAAGGTGSSLAILYLFPLAGCAILAPLVLALFAAAVVTLILLGESGYQVLLSASAASTSHAGLYGGAFFIVVYTINRLAARLIKQEALAQKRGRDLRLQEAINRVVVADMSDGVLVVGPDTTVHAGNFAGACMLGVRVKDLVGVRLDDDPALVPIANVFRNWKAGVTAMEGAYVTIKTDGPESTPVSRVKLSFASVETSIPGKERTVIFMRDVSEIEEQAQQLKLASMGRLTASIAHEVRNPLSAISHAASLLREDVQDPVQLRLLGILGDNVLRLDRMVEDILKLSRKAQPQDKPLVLRPFLTELVAEFTQSHALVRNPIAISAMADHRVRFDPLHLREVLVNLFSNALRYASGAEGSIRVHVRPARRGRLELHVQDDGMPITEEVRAHLFEPFYTTSSKGTGLGLYLARELCLNNSAMLDYEFRTDPGRKAPSGRFIITMPLDHA